MHMQRSTHAHLGQGLLGGGGAHQQLRLQERVDREAGEHGEVQREVVKGLGALQLVAAGRVA